MSLFALLLACQAPAPTASAAPEGAHLTPFSELSWTPLNPARGDASPQAATLWGDRAAAGPSGFLVRFKDGFSSPPHIHNVSYRAVVLEGAIHNDDPGAAEMWMGPGSFWTQPRSAAHITSSQGASMAYVEIDAGPYLVHPADQAQALDEKPVNLDTSNLVWAPTAVPGLQLSRLWGQPDQSAGGVMLRIAPGAHADLASAQPIRALSVAGSPTQDPADPGTGVAPGGLLSGTAFSLTCPSSAQQGCTLYLRLDAALQLSP